MNLFSAEQKKRAELFERFMRHVHIGIDRGDCWTWLGNKPDGRYGHFSVDGQSVKAHRWIYMFIHGSVNDRDVIRHRCDNPQCVNPAHLLCGSPSENSRDAVERGRWANRQGTKHPLARLGETEVRAIRTRVSLGISRRKIANEFGISYQHVGKIARRENWGHI